MMLKRIFWNSAERRLAMFWRLALQTVITVIFIIILGIPLYLVSFLVAGQVPSSVLEELPQWVQYASFAVQSLAFFLSVVIVTRFIDRRKFADLGLHFNRDWWRDFGFGLVLGALLMVLIFGVELAAGWVTVTGVFVTPDSLPGASFGVAIIGPVMLYIMVGFYEELYSRGYHIKNMAEGFSALPFLDSNMAIWLATIGSSVIFGLLHAGNPNATAISTFNIFLAGFLLAAGYLLTGELAISMGLHMTWNFFQGNVFGFPVSGTEAGSTFIAVEQGGNPLLTGGAFGPEAGLLGVAAMVLGVMLIMGWVRWRKGELKLQQRLAVADFNYAPANEVAKS